jgi:hypothetical protein
VQYGQRLHASLPRAHAARMAQLTKKSVADQGAAASAIVTVDFACVVLGLTPWA